MAAGAHNQTNPAGTGTDLPDLPEIIAAAQRRYAGCRGKKIMRVAVFAAVACLSIRVAEGDTSNSQPPTGSKSFDSSQNTNPSKTSSEVSENQTKLEEIIVTATKTGAMSAQKTPIALSAFSGAELQRSQTVNLKDLVASAPGLNIAQSLANTEIYIRGIGTNNVNAGSDPDVTMQVDGVYIARPSVTTNDFADIGRIEVLRGPQGTLYGRNAVGGTINIVSKQPSDTLTGQNTLTLGNYAAVEYQSYISGPLIPHVLQASLAVTYLRHNAYLENIVPTGNDISSANHGGVRGQLRWEASEDITATTRFDWTVVSENINSYSELIAPPAALYGPNGTRSVPLATPLANSLIGSFSTVALNTPNRESARNGGISEDIDWDFSPNLSLKSISAYRKESFNLVVDSDNTELPSTVNHQVDNENQVSQEFDLKAHYSAFDAIGGLYYFHENDDFSVSSKTLGPLTHATPRIPSDSYAAFAQGVYHVLPTVNLTLGYRYTLEDKHLDQNFMRTIGGIELPGFPFLGSTTRHFTGRTPKFGIDWQVSPDAMLYASATRGYKSGGINYGATTVAAESFNPESIWSYETGLKSEWLDHTLRANLTGFYYDYKNLQVQSLLSPGNVAIGNAATATVKGIEAEINARPTPDWLLTANLTYLDARYGQFPAASVPAGLAPYVAANQLINANPPGSPAAPTFVFNASGKMLDAAPKYTVFVAAQRDFTLRNGAGAYVRAEYYWQDRVYYDPTNVAVQSQGAYALVNAFIGYDTADHLWQTQLWGKNLANKGYFITTAANGNAPSGLIAAPRTFGVSLTRRFGGG
jgi:iron complex outermembrane receptor protein